MIQIIITKSTRPSYWYHNHIGEVFDVYDTGNDSWYIPMKDRLTSLRKDDEELLFIQKDDTEIFDRKKKIERIKSKL
jgi:hypothetical protein